MFSTPVKAIFGLEINFFDDALEIGKTYKKNVSSVFLMQAGVTVREFDEIAKKLANGKSGMVHLNEIRTQVTKNGKMSRKQIAANRIAEDGTTY